MRTRTCVCQGGGVSFSEKFVYMLNYDPFI